MSSQEPIGPGTRERRRRGTSEKHYSRHFNSNKGGVRIAGRKTCRTKGTIVCGPFTGANSDVRRDYRNEAAFHTARQRGERYVHRIWVG